MLTRMRELLVGFDHPRVVVECVGFMAAIAAATDLPDVHASGDEPHRVLVLGNGIAMSYGVLSHQIGFGGNLARQLAERTSRGSDVQLVVDVQLDARAALASLADVRPARFDAIVLTLGGAESVRLMPARAWRRDLDALLDRLVAETTSTEMLLVEVPEIGRVVHVPEFARSSHRAAHPRVHRARAAGRRIP